MKKRMILPLVAVLFALVGAFASTFMPQPAWFKPTDDVAQQGEIDFPEEVSTENPCLVQPGIQCTIGERNAYVSYEHANTEDETGLLRFN